MITNQISSVVLWKNSTFGPVFALFFFLTECYIVEVCSDNKTTSKKGLPSDLGHSHS